MSSLPSLASVKRRRAHRLLREWYGDNCHWCGKPMDFEAKDAPASATIEHLIPRCEGGRNALFNLRLAHSRCNNARSNGSTKGAGRAGEKTMLTGLRASRAS